MCGLSLGDKSTDFNIISPFALSHRNQTISNNTSQETILSYTVLQKLQNPAGMTFDVITVRISNCKGIGKVTFSLLSLGSSLISLVET